MISIARCKNCNYAGPLFEFRLFKDSKLLICPKCDSAAVRIYNKVPVCTHCGSEPSLPPGNLCATCEAALRQDSVNGRIRPGGDGEI